MPTKSPSAVAANSIEGALKRREARKSTTVAVYAFRVDSKGSYSMPFIAPDDESALRGIRGYAIDHPEVSTARVYKFAEFDYSRGTFKAFNPIELKGEEDGEVK